MDAREAAQTAKDYIHEVFADEEIMDIGLEEVVFDESMAKWQITIGFARTWDQPNNTFTQTVLGPQNLKRSYKVVHIQDFDGRVMSLTDRVLPAAE